MFVARRQKELRQAASQDLEGAPFHPGSRGLSFFVAIVATWSLVSGACVSAAGSAVIDVRLPDVLIDLASQRALVVAPDRRLVAVDTRDGRVDWTAAKGLRPLCRVGDWLTAWASDPEKPNLFQVSWIDPATGAVASRSIAIELPEWISVSPAPGRSFDLESRSEGDTLVLGWQARGWWVGGARPSKEAQAQAQRSDAGVIRVERETGEVTLAGRQEPPSLPSQSSPSSRPERPFLYHWGASLSAEPILTGARVSVLGSEVVGNESRIVWHSVSSGAAEPPIVLGDAQKSKVIVSLDRRYLFVCEQEADACERLAIFSLEDRSRIAELLRTPSVAAAAIAGRRLFILADSRSQPPHRALYALDLDSALVSWSLDVLPPPRFPPPR